jgi:hypothetical protein
MIPLEHPGLQERHDQSIEFTVANAPSHSFHQCVMVNVIKASLDIALDSPLERQLFCLLPASHSAREQQRF